MKWVLFTLSLLMAVIGASCIWYGYPIVEVERGWTLTIVGAMGLVGGALVFAMALALIRIESLFTAGGSVGALASPLSSPSSEQNSPGFARAQPPGEEAEASRQAEGEGDEEIEGKAPAVRSLPPLPPRRPTFRTFDSVPPPPSPDPDLTAQTAPPPAAPPVAAMGAGYAFAQRPPLPGRAQSPFAGLRGRDQAAPSVGTAALSPADLSAPEGDLGRSEADPEVAGGANLAPTEPSPEIQAFDDSAQDATEATQVPDAPATESSGASLAASLGAAAPEEGPSELTASEKVQARFPRFPARSLAVLRGPWPAPPEPRIAPADESDEPDLEAQSSPAGHASPAGAEAWFEQALASLDETSDPGAGADQPVESEPSQKPEIIGRHETEGTLYVMFADGSIEARSEAGVYRFDSLAALKAHIEGLR